MAQKQIKEIKYESVLQMKINAGLLFKILAEEMEILKVLNKEVKCPMEQATDMGIEGKIR